MIVAFTPTGSQLSGPAGWSTIIVDATDHLNARFNSPRIYIVNSTQKTETPTRGRPRSFDRADALLRAMRVFWACGYEGATLTALQEAMGGIAPPSFYAAFGSKEALFREAVELYSRTLGQPMMKALEEGSTARASIEALLYAAAEAFCKPGLPRGCMLVQGALDSAPGNQNVQDYVRGGAKRFRSGYSAVSTRANYHLILT